MRTRIAIVCALFLLGAGGLRASTDVSFGVSASNGGVNGFYLNVGQYYGVPEQQVVYVRERSIPDDEIPVVFFLAREAHVQPQIIIEQRLGGRSWMDISLGFHLSPAIFYVPYDGDPGPPYGRAYGYYRHHRRADWGRIRLGDDDVVNMVNMRFMHDHYGYAPRDIIAMRGQGKAFHQFEPGPKLGGRPHGGKGPEGGPGMHPQQGGPKERGPAFGTGPGGKEFHEKGRSEGPAQGRGHGKGKGGKGGGKGKEKDDGRY